MGERRDTTTFNNHKREIFFLRKISREYSYNALYIINIL